ncbi:hypothetical protein B0H13DRAFT_1860270 [Mycena leptocephala]|nr:hypothetical protein B0H13DRAFT_1860270 [Mycena leptocephala]
MRPLDDAEESARAGAAGHQSFDKFVVALRHFDAFRHCEKTVLNDAKHDIGIQKFYGSCKHFSRVAAFSALIAEFRSFPGFASDGARSKEQGARARTGTQAVPSGCSVASPNEHRSSEVEVESTQARSNDGEYRPVDRSLSSGNTRIYLKWLLDKQTLRGAGAQPNSDNRIEKYSNIMGTGNLEPSGMEGWWAQMTRNKKQEDWDQNPEVETMEQIPPSSRFTILLGVYKNLGFLFSSRYTDLDGKVIDTEAALNGIAGGCLPAPEAEIVLSYWPEPDSVKS